MTQPQVRRPPSLPQARSGNNTQACLFSCLAALSAAVLLAVVGAIGIYQFISGQIDGFLDNYTATAPVELPPVTLDEAERAALEARLIHFAEALEGEGRTQTLTLTAEELNAALLLHPDTAQLADHLHLDIGDGHLMAQVSFPLGELGLPMLQDRWLNGRARLSASLSQGRLLVFFDEVTVGDQALPEEVMGQLRQENLAADLQTDPEARAFLARIESFRLTPGTLTIRAQPATAADAQGEGTTGEAAEGEGEGAPV